MTDVLTALTSLAVAVFRERAGYDARDYPLASLLFVLDPVFIGAQRAAFINPSRHPSIQAFAEQAFAEPDLSLLATRPGELDPMVLHQGGGFRMSPATTVTGLLVSAFFIVYFLRLNADESTFVRVVLENFEELRRAARGERVRAYRLLGLAGVTLAEGAQLSTPWGVLRPAQPGINPGFLSGHQPISKCVMAEPLLVPVTIDRSPQPTFVSDPTLAATEQASRVLLPLACALAARDSAAPAVPVPTWSAFLLPFQTGWGTSTPLLPPHLKADVEITERITEIEEWARIVAASHSSSLDIVARRLVSATTHRTDLTDSLIDSVMVWENLLGTTSEVTFRVTAALAKLLEPDSTKRRAYRKTLARVYDTRSRVVHGAAVDQSEINSAATEAIQVAVRALRESYLRGSDWLSMSSSERADALLLG